MVQPNVEELATTIVNNTFTASQERLALTLWRILADTAAPVSPDTLAEAAQRPREEVMATLRQIPYIEYDESGNLLGLGLKLVPMPHQLHLGEHTISAFCALETLFFPVVLQRPARVVSTCPVTKTKIQMTVTPEGIEHLEPTSAVMSAPRPRQHVELKEAGRLREGGCNNTLFFSSQDAVAPWLPQHPDFILFPVEEAFQFGRELAIRLRARAEET